MMACHMRNLPLTRMRNRVALLPAELPLCTSAQCGLLHDIEQAAAARRHELERVVVPDVLAPRPAGPKRGRELPPPPPTAGAAAVASSTLASGAATAVSSTPAPPPSPPPLRGYLTVAARPSRPPVGTVSAVWGSSDGQGIRNAAQFFWSGSVVEAADGALLITESGNSRIRRLHDGVVSTFAGGENLGFGNGAAETALFNFPRATAFDACGRLLVVDEGNYCIRRVTMAGEVTTYAGTGEEGGADGPTAEATFRALCGMAVFPDDGTVVVLQGNGGIRTISPDGVVATLDASCAPGVGGGADHNANGLNGLEGGGGGEHACRPVGLAVGPDGAVYFADLRNHCVRRLARDGRVTTVAGDGVSGLRDGPAAAARFASPHAVAVASDGAIFVADCQNHCVRQIGTDGVVSTFAGSGRPELRAGLGAAAAIGTPTGLCLNEGRGVLYVTTGFKSNHRLCCITVGPPQEALFPIVRTWALVQCERAQIASNVDDGAARAEGGDDDDDACVHETLRLLMKCGVVDVLKVVLAFAYKRKPASR